MKFYLKTAAPKAAVAGETINRFHLRYYLREIYRAAREIHAELGPDCKRKHYAAALAARFSGGRYGCERDVELPCSKGAQDSITADFTFLNRKVLVRVVLYQWEITPGVCRDLWERLDATGVPLGLILNFGSPAFEYRRVQHQGYVQQWRREEVQAPVRAAAPAAVVSGLLCVFCRMLSGWYIY
jgi:GxxExxY protein